MRIISPRWIAIGLGLLLWAAWSVSVDVGGPDTNSGSGDDPVIGIVE